MQSVDISVATFLFFRRRILCYVVPLPYECLEICADIRLELANALRCKGARYDLPLSRMCCSIADVEEATVNGNESIVEVTRIKRCSLANALV